MMEYLSPTTLDTRVTFQLPWASRSSGVLEVQLTIGWSLKLSQMSSISRSDGRQVKNSKALGATSSRLQLSVLPPSDVAEVYSAFSEISLQATIGSCDNPLGTFSFNWDLDELTIVDDGQWKIDAAELKDTLSDESLQITLYITSGSTPNIATSSTTKLIARILEGGEVIDTEFVLYSRRRMSGEHSKGAQDPLSVYANSDHLQSLFDGRAVLRKSGLLSSARTALDQPSPEPWTDEYDYESDSDLDDEPEGETKTQGLSLNAKAAQNTRALGTGNKPQAISPARSKKTVQIKDVAYLTWKALMYYLCTSEVSFAPLSGPKPSAHARARLVPPMASARSMYRLADKYGLHELRSVALEHIRAGLAENMILPELIRKFTARYEEVREIEVAFALKHWSSLRTSQSLPQFLSDILAGKAADSAAALQELLSKIGS